MTGEADRALREVNSLVRERVKLAQLACDKYATEPTTYNLTDARQRLDDVMAVDKLRRWVERRVAGNEPEFYMRAVTEALAAHAAKGE